MNIAICDDEQQDIDILYNYCTSCKLPYNISTFLSASALIEAFKSQFYDLIFLDVLHKNNELGSTVFSSLFKKGNPTLIFKFLDEETTFWEDLQVMLKCPTIPFMKAFFKRLF